MYMCAGPFRLHMHVGRYNLSGMLDLLTSRAGLRLCHVRDHSAETQPQDGILLVSACLVGDSVAWSKALRGTVA